MDYTREIAKALIQTRSAASTIAGGDMPPLATATGLSGRTYEFQMHPIGATYRDRPGARLAQIDYWDALYWGETDNFWRRLTSRLKVHEKWQRVVALGVTHIGTLHVSGDLSQRESIETDLRLANPTPCNDQ